jgi:Ser/Thr protein kinase RdoA (MazF antagonist)
MPRGRLIGEGRTAEVFDWGEGQVLKLYRDWCPRDWPAHEETLGRALTKAGVAAPAALETVEVEGRVGIVFERVAGRSLREQITSAPWRTGWAGRRLARLHRHLHLQRVLGAALPQLRERIAGTVERARAVLGADADRALSILAGLPDGEAVCHFDFHPDNVLGEGDAIRIIDWSNAALGNPAADVARTLVMIRSPYFPPDVPRAVRPVVRSLKRWLARAYEAEYLSCSGMMRAEVEAWLVPIAAARIWEEVPGEREWLLGIIGR